MGLDRDCWIINIRKSVSELLLPKFQSEANDAALSKPARDDNMLSERRLRSNSKEQQHLILRMRVFAVHVPYTCTLDRRTTSLRFPLIGLVPKVL